MRWNWIGAAVLAGCAGMGADVARGEDPEGRPAQAAPAPAPEPRRDVDLVLCLDTSNSMDGLIDSARRRLWDVVNDLTRLRPVPRLRVALLSYGNNRYPQNEGWVRVDAPFTDDLDFISERLFALTTCGGEEYVGRVLDAALDRLKWSEDAKALRIAVVAGNESADQDAVKPFRDACRAAAKRGIVVNSVYCGSATDDIAPGWREVARLGEGEFAAIEHDRAAVVCATPYDDLLCKLSESLNATYLPFGRFGAAGCANQVAQDVNANGLGAAAGASRAATKANAVYRNGSWDLVDAVRERDLDLATVATEDLPACMRTQTLAERVKYVEAMAKKRAAIQKEIADLAAKREEYVAAERKKLGSTDDTSLAGALRRAVRRQAERKGFAFAAK